MEYKRMKNFTRLIPIITINFLLLILFSCGNSKNSSNSNSGITPDDISSWWSDAVKNAHCRGNLPNNLQMDTWFNDKFLLSNYKRDYRKNDLVLVDERIEYIDIVKRLRGVKYKKSRAFFEKNGIQPLRNFERPLTADCDKFNSVINCLFEEEKAKLTAYIFARYGYNISHYNQAVPNYQFDQIEKLSLEQIHDIVYALSFIPKELNFNNKPFHQRKTNSKLYQSHLKYNF